MPVDSSSSSFNSISTEEMRLQNYRNLIKKKNDVEIQDLESNHAEDIQALVERQAHQIEELRHDFEVRFSNEAETLSEKLNETRFKNEGILKQEEKTGEIELEKVKTANQQKIEKYKKDSEAQLAKIRHQLQVATENLHKQARLQAQPKNPNESEQRQ